MSQRERTATRQDAPMLELNLTPMIDVVFQLIIFFMCAMKFKTLEEKLEVTLPKEMGIDPSRPRDSEEPLTVRVRVRQAPEDGVPRIFMLGEEVRPDLGRGVAPLPSTPSPDSPRSVIEADQARHADHWSRYMAPKLADLEGRLRDCAQTGGDFTYELDAGPRVRHEYAVGVLDTLVAAGIQEVTIRGTAPTRAGR